MSHDNMKTTVRVDTTSDASGIDKIIQKTGELQAIIAKFNGKGLEKLSKGVDSIASKVKATAGLGEIEKGQTTAMRALQRRWSFEQRMNRQRDREEAESARVADRREGDALRAIRAKMTASAAFAQQRQREERATERDAARAEKARASAEKSALRDFQTRWNFTTRMSRQRAAEERAAAREEAQSVAQAERERMAAVRRRASVFGEVRQNGREAVTRGRETYGSVQSAARQTMVGVAAAVAASVKGIAGRMQVDAAETLLKVFGDNDGKKFDDGAIAKMRKEWLDNTAFATGNTATEAIKAFTEINKAGIKSPKENTQLALKAGAGLELETKQVASLMGLVDRNLGAKSTPKRMHSVLNSIAVAAREDPTNAPEIVEGMKRGFGALSLGNMSPEDLAVLVSGGQSVGIQPGKAGTFIATLMKDLTAGSYAKGQRGKDLNEAARALGFGNAKNMARAASTDSTETIFRVLERLEGMSDQMRAKTTHKLSQTQWSDEDLQMIQGLKGLKSTHAAVHDPRNANFLDEASAERMKGWDKQWARSKAIFGRFWESIGAGFDEIYRTVNTFFYESAVKYDFGRVTQHVKSFLGGFVKGLGFDDVRSLLESTFGKPGEQGVSYVQQLAQFGKGLAEGLRSIAGAVRNFMGVFTGGDTSAETIGRLTGKIIGLSAALIVIAPVVSVLGAIGTALTGFAAIVAAAATVLRTAGLLGGKPPVPTTPPGAPVGASGGILGRVLGTLGRLVPAFAAPLTMDPSKADNDRLMKMLGTEAGRRLREREGTRGWVDPPSRSIRESQERLRGAVEQNTLIQKQHLEGGGDLQGLIHRTSFGGDDVRDAIDRMGGKIQAASITGAVIARAAGTGSVGSAMGAAGIPYTPGAGGAGLSTSRPGGKLPDIGVGPRSGVGGDTASPDQKSGGSRSWRNNNPGNIEYGPFARSMGATGHDGRFAKFPSYEAGRKAQETLLFESKGYRDLTLGQAIRRWAPASENNVPAYIAAMGGDPGKRMSEYSPEQRAKLLDAMQRHEGWKPGTIAGGGGGSGGAADAGGGSVLGRMRDLKSSGRVIGDQCVALAKAAVGVSGSVTEWRKGVGAEEGTLKPGTPIATFLDRQGRQSSRYAGGGTGTMGARLDHAGVFESYLKDKDGKTIGMRIAEQFRGSGGVRSKAYMFGRGWGEGNGSNYHAILGPDGQPLGGSRNPLHERAARMMGKGAFSQPQDVGDGIKGTGWHKVGPTELAAETPAQKLAREAPQRPRSGGAGGGGGHTITAPITIQNNGDAEHTANQVQRRIQDTKSYLTHDLSFESV